jgi:hypothetical protein
MILQCDKKVVAASFISKKKPPPRHYLMSLSALCYVDKSAAGTLFGRVLKLTYCKNSNLNLFSCRQFYSIISNIPV